MTDDKKNSEEASAPAPAAEAEAEVEAEAKTEAEVKAANENETDLELEIETEIEETDQALIELETELIEVKDQMLRAVAETENIRKRAHKQTEDAHKFANASFAKSLLAVADNLHRTVAAVSEDEAAGHELLNTLLDGVRGIERDILSAFTQNGIEKLEPVGTPFDPNFHEAMFEQEDDTQPAGTVVQLIEAGYVLNGRLLRAARVGVSKLPAAPTGGATGDEDKSD